MKWIAFLATMVCAAAAGAVEPGARPLELIEAMEDGALKDRLLSCQDDPFVKTAFSIAHRGAPLGYPEHTRESYVAAAEMGAGIIECDVTFTRDRQQVCRHAQCDLHATTNILATILAATCAVPPGPDEEARCCTSDITLSEFKSLCGIIDGGETCGTLMSHAESIALFDGFGVGFTPELKASDVATPDDARLMIDAYVSAGIAPERVWPQSFNLDAVRFWIDHTDYGAQAVFLDGRFEDPAFDHTDPATWRPSMGALREIGVGIIAPPLWMLLALDGDHMADRNTFSLTGVQALVQSAAGVLEGAVPQQLRVRPDCVRSDRFLSGSTVEAVHWCSRSFRVAKGCAVRRSRREGRLRSAAPGHLCSLVPGRERRSGAGNVVIVRAANRFSPMTGAQARSSRAGRCRGLPFGEDAAAL